MVASAAMLIFGTFAVTSLKRDVPLRQQWPGLVLAVGATLAVGAAFGYIESRRIARPIEIMSRSAMEMAGGDLSERQFSQFSEELDSLGQSLNHLASSLGKRIEDLSASNQKLTIVLESSVSGMIIVDPKGIVTHANKAALNILGENRSEVVGIPFSKALKNSDLSAMTYRAVYNRQSLRRQITLGSQNQRIVDVAAVPLTGSAPGFASSGGLVVLQDLTEARRMERVRTDFVQNVSHELRTPVTVVMGFAETLRDAPPEDPEAIREMAGLIYEEASRLSDLVEKLLHLAKLESGYLPIRHTTVFPADELQSLVRKMGPLARQKNQSLRLELPEGSSQPERFSLDADKDMYNTIFTNLLDNAIKYAGEGGSVEIGFRPDGAGVLHWVRDDGPGISAEDIPRVFERFYRGAKDRSRVSGGSGLGLAIVKHGVALHGGRVWVESKPGGGATFYVWLPAEKPAS